MDHTEINRLNFSNIVQKQLEKQKLEKTSFKPSKIHTTAYNRKIPNPNEQSIIQDKVDSIIAYVHSKLMDKKLRGPNEKKTKNPNTTSTNRASLIIDNNCTCKAKDIVNNTGDHNKLSIPRIKVLCSHKKKERLHHTIPLNHDNHYECQKRMEDAKQQHRVFECMLEDQKQIKNERQLMTRELHTMRGHLNDIRGRLDSSIKKLDKNKTYSECQMESNEETHHVDSSRQQKDVNSAKEQEKC